LELLFLGGCPIDGSGLKYLSGMNELRRLSLSATKIDDKALLQLQQLPKLEELSLYNCAITDEGVPALAKLKGLKRLMFSDTTKLSEAGRQKLGEALPDTHIE
jgi:Leucine-rich repeat (LRR) protein